MCRTDCEIWLNGSAGSVEALTRAIEVTPRRFSQRSYRAEPADWARDFFESQSIYVSRWCIRRDTYVCAGTNTQVCKLPTAPSPGLR